MRIRSFHLLSIAAALVVSSCAATPPTPPTSATGCNGADVLCGRAYDAVAYVTTHNAMSSSAYGFAGPNQTLSMSQQLTSGVRALMLDVHRNGDSAIPTNAMSPDAILLCHEYCGLGYIDLTVGLTEIRTWLDAHPREVVTLILENYVSAAALESAFNASGLSSMLSTHEVGTAWPTLQQMIDAGQRVVVMTDSQGGQRPWLLPVFSEAWDTNYSALTTSDLTCAVNRGVFSNRLIILNNFLTNPIASPLLADQANASPFLANRVSSCRASWNGRVPNFVTVDYFERGSATDVVRSLNGI